MIGSRFDRYLFHDDTLAGCIGSSDFVYNLHALKHLSENRMFVIQPWGAADFLILCNHFLREALTASSTAL